MLPGRLHGASIKRVFPLLFGKKFGSVQHAIAKSFPPFLPSFYLKRKWGEEEEEDCKIEENEEEEECFLQVSFSTSPLKSLFSPSSPSGEKTMFALRIYIKWGGLKLEEGISYPGGGGATYVATLRFPPPSQPREKKSDVKTEFSLFFLRKKEKSGSDNCVFFSSLPFSTQFFSLRLPTIG